LIPGSGLSVSIELAITVLPLGQRAWS
jgi:hypothetical protein